jgi:type II secretory pathway pseudopilin PulG
MVSVVVVGVLAVAATPRFLSLYRDRRVLAAAAAAADLVRFARSQAIGRGGATMVRYSAAGGANGRPLIEVREAIQASGAPLPLASCLLPNWANASTTSRELTRQDYGNGMWSLASFEFTSDAGTTQTFAELCFTPRGRTFVRYQAGGAWVALQGVPRIRVTNSDTLYDRFVFLPPNGVARVQM